MPTNQPHPSLRARPHGQRDLAHPLTLLLLLGAILVPLPSAAQSQGPRPGATDPAVSYTEWRDDEIFVPKLPAQLADHTMSVYEADANFSSVTEVASANPEQHDAIAAAAGRILTRTGESLVYAYRGTGPDGLALGFFDPAAAPAYTLPNLAARASGSTDFFDIAAADINGARAPDGEYRDEVAVAFLTGPRTAVVETYRYTATVDAQNNVTPFLARASSGPTLPSGWPWAASKAARPTTTPTRPWPSPPGTVRPTPST